MSLFGAPGASKQRSGSLGGPLGVLWGSLGSCWEPLGLLRGHLEGPGSSLGRLLGPVSCDQGWDPFESAMGPVGPPREPLESEMGPSSSSTSSSFSGQG